MLIPILANALGVEEFGRYGLALSVAALVLVFVDFGSRQLIIREVGRVDSSASQYCVNGLLVKSVLAIVGIGGGVLFAFRAYAPAMAGLVLCACVAYSCWAASDFFLAFYHSREKMHVAAAMQSGQAIVFSSGAICLVLLFGVRAQGVLAWQMACFATVTVVACAIVARGFRIRWKAMSVTFIRRYIGELWVFAVLFIASQGIVHFPPIVLSFRVGESEVGVYQAAARAILAIELLPRLFNLGVFPVLMKKDSVEVERWNRLAESSLRYSILVGLWLASGLALVSREVSSFIFRAEGFGEVGGNLQLMCVLLFCRFISYPLGTLLLALNRERWCAKVTPLAALLAAGITWTAASRFGALGASMGWVVGGLCVTTGYALGTWGATPHLFRSRAMMHAVLSTLVVTVVVLASYPLPFGTRLGIGIFAAPCAAFVCRAFTQHDLSVMKAALLGGIRGR